MKWEEVIKRDDIVGGEIEIQDGAYVYRGPIESIAIVDGYVRISTKWTARLNKLSFGDGWEEVEGKSSSFHVEYCPPSDIGGKRIVWSPPAMGPCVIFPKGGSTLDVARVRWMSKK